MLLDEIAADLADYNNGMAKVKLMDNLFQAQ